MRAVVYTSYGPPEVLRIQEVDKPTPKDDEVLVRIRAASVAAADWRMRKADPFLARLFNGLFRPKKVNVLGFELAGDIEAVGSRVSRFRVGEAVFAFTGFGFGAHAEYRCLRDSGKPGRDGLIAKKPTNLSYEEAAGLPCGALTAHAFLRKAGLQRGARLLVYGASGSVGTAAVQLGRHMGAEVAGVCSAANAELVASLGAGRVFDYTKDDLTQVDPKFDVVFDAVGKISAAQRRSALARGGRFVSVKGSAKLQPGDLEMLRELAEAGEAQERARSALPTGGYRGSAPVRRGRAQEGQCRGAHWGLNHDARSPAACKTIGFPTDLRHSGPAEDETQGGSIGGLGPAVQPKRVDKTVDWSLALADLEALVEHLAEREVVVDRGVDADDGHGAATPHGTAAQVDDLLGTALHIDDGAHFSSLPWRSHARVHRSKRAWVLDRLLPATRLPCR